MRRTASFRRDFSIAVDDYNTFHEERRQTQEAFAEPTQWPSRVTGRADLEAEPTLLRSLPASPVRLPKTPETLPAVFQNLRVKLDETKGRPIQEQVPRTQREDVSAKNVHFLDDYRLQAGWAQEEEDTLGVEAFKANLLARRELARQQRMAQMQPQGRPDPSKYLLQLEALQQIARAGVATLRQWHGEQQWPAEQHPTLLENEFNRRVQEAAQQLAAQLREHERQEREKQELA